MITSIRFLIAPLVLVAAVLLATPAEPASAQSVARAELEIANGAFERVSVGDNVTIHLNITIENYEHSRKMYVSITIPGRPNQEVFYNVTAGKDANVSVPIEILITEELLTAGCGTGQITIGYSASLSDPDGSLWHGHGGNLPVPCTHIPVAPDTSLIVQTEVCGNNNDNVSFSQAGVAHSVDSWAGNATTVRFSVHAPYYLADDAVTNHALTDPGDCFTDPPIVPEFVEFICGNDNDVYSNPDQPAKVTMEDSGWRENTRTFTFYAAQNYQIPADFQTARTVYDDGDCYTFEPIVPEVVTEVCGSGNDVYSDPDQPDFVEMTDSGWSANTRTFTFSAAENHMLPDDFETVHVVTDAAIPCPTDATVPPLQTQVCGPNNDQVTILPQPEGVTLDSDSGWTNNTRTIEFAVDPLFETTGATTFTLTDGNEACPPSTKNVSVQLETSDDGSVAGTPWQLLAPMTAQAFGIEPFTQGTVGADNSILLQDLIAGEYRLVVNAEGYEAVDSVITVTDGTELQQVTLPMTALQPVETPTPSPTP